ncbi:MAG: hydrogenase iron-sulfur subunit, partial [Desulfotomaculales bacterium]
HYVSGNYNAERRAKVTRRLLDTLGIEPDRFLLTWISASEGARFAETVTEFTARLKELGPNPLRVAREEGGVS